MSVSQTDDFLADGLGEGVVTSPSSTTLAVDPMSDFLAREQAVLGEDAALFQQADVNTTAPVSFPATSTMVPTATIPQAMDLFSTDPIPTSGSFSRAESTAASFGIEEPEAIQKWRVEFAERIRERDAASIAKKEKLLKEAQEVTERFYAEYQQKKANGAATKQSTTGGADSPSSKDSNFWRRVYKNTEQNPKEREVVNLRANQPKATTPNGSTPSTASGRDTGRMKSLLAELKSDQGAPCSDFVVGA